MVQKISKSFIVILINICLFSGFSLPVAAQEQQPEHPMSLRERKQKEEQEKREKERERQQQMALIPTYNGINIGVDVWGAGKYLLSGDVFSAELQVAVNIRNMFLPTVEAGYGFQDEWGDGGVHSKGKAPYFRIGMDYNLLHKKKEKNSFLFAGLRYGFSPLNFSVTNAPLNDPIYGGVIDTPNLSDEYWGGSVPFAKDMSCSLHWMEAVLGVKVQVYRNFSMGWSARVRFKLGGKKDINGNPDYIPGYGGYRNSNFGVTYSLIYHIPSRKLQRAVPINK